MRPMSVEQSYPLSSFVVSFFVKLAYDYVSQLFCKNYFADEAWPSSSSFITGVTRVVVAIATGGFVSHVE